MGLLRRARSNDQLEHITHEMYRQNLELAETNKTLTMLRQIDEVVLGPTTEVNKVAQMITDLLVKDSDFTLGMLYVSDDEAGIVNIRGLSGQSPLNSENLQLIKNQLSVLSVRSTGQGPPPSIASIKGIAVIDSFKNIFPDLTPREDEALKSSLSCQTLFVCPLVVTGGTIGVLILGLAIREGDVSEFQNKLVERLSGAISIAVQNHLLYAELQAATSALKVQNQKLKELDESKDEFISMASHQLRTPLTSVKGYLSMVLEGDVGPVTEAERTYIKRAFDGAQKMVYLIADLLNVSRLQTGKFVIDNKPTNLADAVESELEQLTEQAAAKKITISYHKPADFPVLNLDETKVRQVIMNFLDNALYYTPSGGTITVEVLATDDSVSYSVTDTGIGVPKAIQHHLFGKFYRADNAKKLRPDGTGLGLFMAKKVIVAEGGAIIFSSTEGKGSTFGFSFPRAKMEVKGGIKPVTPTKTSVTTVKTEAPATLLMAGSKQKDIDPHALQIPSSPPRPALPAKTVEPKPPEPDTPEESQPVGATVKQLFKNLWQ